MAAHRYWQIHVSANNAPDGWASVQMAELQFRAAAGGSPLTGTWTSTPPATSDPSFALANIHDGSLVTFYASLGGFVPIDCFVAIDLGFGGASDVLQLAIAPREGQEIYAPRAFGIYFSDNGSDWSLRASFSGIAAGDWADDTFKLFDAAGVPGIYDSRMSEYLVEGSNNAVFVSRMSQYIVLGPSGGSTSQLMLGSF